MLIPKSLWVAAQIVCVVIAGPSVGAGLQEKPESHQDRSLTIKLADGRALNLQGFRVLAKHGLSDAQCGVTIAEQRVLTLGTGKTEVYTCDELIAAGVLPPDHGVQRIGLIYDWSTRNAEARTAVVLREERRRWHVDADMAGRFDGVPASRSIPALRRALRSKSSVR